MNPKRQPKSFVQRGGIKPFIFREDTFPVAIHQFPSPVRFLFRRFTTVSQRPVALNRPPNP
ncbi:MAG TPA: hypothetical protein VJT54_15415 [Verrucomicrobiae bacterium]|nr:hypothetical protein [Verrucomicrobiae bacterium]